MNYQRPAGAQTASAVRERGNGMKMKGKTIIDEQTGLVIVQAGDDLAADRWAKIGTIIESIDELWQLVNDITAQPHISIVLDNLQRMNALREKIQTKIRDRLLKVR